MPNEPPEDREPDASGAPPLRELELSTSLVPRWLALLVLIALLAAAGFSVASLLEIEPPQRPSAAGEGPAPDSR